MSMKDELKFAMVVSGHQYNYNLDVSDASVACQQLGHSQYASKIVALYIL